MRAQVESLSRNVSRLMR
nr:MULTISPECIES: hypothetical protein [Enterobacteriaceae]